MCTRERIGNELWNYGIDYRTSWIFLINLCLHARPVLMCVVFLLVAHYGVGQKKKDMPVLTVRLS